MLRKQIMDEQQPPQPSQQRNHLGEISYLFLSSVREKTGNGAQRPQRIPPRPAHSIDLTPEEFEAAASAGDAQEMTSSEERGRAPIPRVTAIVAGHLNGKQFDRAKDYARHLASTGMRVGLIECDASEFRVFCFDRHPADAPPSAEAECSFDPRRMNEVLDELSWDVSRWLLVLPTPRVPEARKLLRECTQWVLLSTCDHDGVIASYRTLKGLTDLWPAERAGEKPELSLALLDAPDQEQAERVAAKLSSVCQQFLSWHLEVEPTVRAGSDRVGEHLVMNCRPTRDKGQLANPPQWEIVSDFLARSKEQAHPKETRPIEPPQPMKLEPPEPVSPASAAPIPQPIPMPQPVSPMSQNDSTRTMPMLSLEGSSTSTKGTPSETADVIDLPGPEMGESGIVDAILRHCANELVECPVTPPMCPRAKLAVSRERRVVLLAVARQGLADLNTIGQAYKWLQENQQLIGMAVPQLAIDTHQTPHLSLLVDQADSAADTLQPMLEGANVTVKTYRKLRWGGKTGLLLEAA